MKLARVEIENYRAIERLDLPLDPVLTVLHGANGHGKTSVLSAIAVGLGSIPTLLPDISGIRFPDSDLRWNGKKTSFPPLRIALATEEGIAWERRRAHQPLAKHPRASLARRQLKQKIDAIVAAEREETEPLDLPIVAFYDTDRAVADTKVQKDDFKTRFPRYEALEGALSPRANFRELVRWFYVKENEELREQRELRDFEYRSKDTNAIRRAIEGMVPGVSHPRIEAASLRFLVSFQSETGAREERALDQLSGGYRIVLALAADLARRMAQGNPHLEDPLQSEAVVLIDEIDLHLHPAWQQRILDDLKRTFPNAQFIVSTHSPQVLTTVRPQHIVALRREGENIVAGRPSAPTFGAEAGDVLFTVMGVDERPDNEFAKKLDEYMRLIEDGQGESEQALSLKRCLMELSPQAPEIREADIEIERHKLLKKMAESR